MNKFNVLVASLMVFAVVAQLALADVELQNEIPEHEDIDEDLEGDGRFENGVFISGARRKVSNSIVEFWTHDPLDKANGIPNLTEKRTPECKESRSKEACVTCCSGLDKSSKFSSLGRWFKESGCTCFSRDNNYEAKLA